MRILVVGATGTIGRAVCDALSPRHEVVRASRHRSALRVDIAQPDSIRALYQAVGRVDAGLEGFTRAAALEAPRGIRVNVVSPPWVTETLRALGRDPTSGLPASQVAQTYVQAVEGRPTGEVLDPRKG